MKQFAGVSLCHRHQARLCLDIRNSESGQTRLRRTNQVARPTHFQVGLRNHKAVFALTQGFEPFLTTF
eukprot:CAMPEP_0184418722 /NCGR_PEP_ID=MMETSP0738-20130409/32169_1 /TAXON_ID=385413 /ORGANISM="Thalassiosira miniscula, Strain CCMP1093" /LENGTH=67 /DNA_ID=CAMNT_0026778949 /DNA_START=10 /DNA_END=213 /DNA_ORIENTATION=-